MIQQSTQLNDFKSTDIIPKISRTVQMNLFLAQSQNTWMISQMIMNYDKFVIEKIKYRDKYLADDKISVCL